MRVSYGHATVKEEQTSRRHWETGKARNVLIPESEYRHRLDTHMVTNDDQVETRFFTVFL